MSKKLIIVGAGGFGREVAWLVERINAQSPTWELVGFADDNPNLAGSLINGYPVLGTCACLSAYPEAFVVCAIGSAKIRKKVVESLGGHAFATLIDPSVLLSDSVTVGEGSILCAGSILTVNITLGKHVIVNVDCTVGHDAVLDDFVKLYPSVNVSGNTHLGPCVEMGTGSQIIQGKNIGDGSIIGAGAVVVRDIPAGCTAVGVPAKPIKFDE